MDTSSPAAPWTGGESILELLAAQEGTRRGELELPDEPPADPTAIRYSAGSYDGVALHHVGIDENGDRANEMVLCLDDLARLSGQPQRLALYEAAQADDVLTHIDPVLSWLGADPALRAAIAPHARWLVSVARHRGPVKLGIALLGVCGDEQDVAVLKTFARHDEFTLYCVVALSNLLADPVDALHDVAMSVEGWGKVNAVERLAMVVEGHDGAKRWLLTDGCENSVLNEYLAYTCATAGELAAALSGDPDEDVLDGACTIMSALCVGGPAEDLDDYLDGAAAAARLLELLRYRCDSLRHLDCVLQLQDWLIDNTSAKQWHERELRGWTPALREQLIATCTEVLRKPQWPPQLRAAFMGDDAHEAWLAWRVAPHVGADLWEDGFTKLREDAVDSGLVFQLTQTDERERQRRLIWWAETRLDLDRIAAGPQLYLFPPAPIREDAMALTFLVQEMTGDLYSERLVAAALRAPVISIRNMSMTALAARPREQWGTTVEDALRRLVQDEPDDDVRGRVQELLS